MRKDFNVATSYLDLMEKYEVQSHPRTHPFPFPLPSHTRFLNIPVARSSHFRSPAPSPAMPFNRMTRHSLSPTSMCKWIWQSAHDRR
jgi:hypothetical protein